MNGSIGAAPMCRNGPAQPHWNAATITPYAAPIDSRFMITAFNGTRTERKTTITRRNDAVRPAPSNDGTGDARYVDNSAPMAPEPVTETSRPEPLVAWDSTS